MFPGLATFGKHGQETMFPGLSTFGETWLGNNVSRFGHLWRNIARKQCFLVCSPLGNMARKQFFATVFPHYFGTFAFARGRQKCARDDN